MKTAYQGTMDRCARAYGTNLSISRKVSYEIANAIRGRTVPKAIGFLERVTKMGEAVPYKRHTGDVGHRKGNMAAGRYPIKAATQILKLVKSAQSNAVDKGLDAENLKIVHVSASHGSSQWRYGRQRRRKAKSTNVDIIVQAFTPVAKAAKTKKTVAPKSAESVREPVQKTVEKDASLKEEKSQSQEPSKPAEAKASEKSQEK